jgi:hypothetical protein
MQRHSDCVCTLKALQLHTSAVLNMQAGTQYAEQVFLLQQQQPLPAFIRPLTPGAAVPCFCAVRTGCCHARFGTDSIV